MNIFVLYKENQPEFKIQIWDKNGDTCIVQEFNNGKKSKKATSKIKEYNKRPYITCKGHRYYLDKFVKVEL